MKLSNFLRFDQTYTGKGLASGSTAEKEVWDSFASSPERLDSAVAAILVGAEALKAGSVHASEDDDGAEEGRVVTRLHKMRERDRTLAKRKKDAVLKKTGALKCEVCSFDFKAAYGPLGTHYAECHHGTPLSTLSAATKTTLDSLHIVCANCHRMLHHGKKWPTVDQLRHATAVEYSYG